MAAPAFQTQTTGGTATTGTLTVPVPTHLAGDVFICMVERSGGESAPAAPTGWTLIADEVDVATTAGSRFAAYWKRAASAAESAPVFAAATNHQIGRMFSVRGAIASGDPIEAVVTGSKTTASTTATMPGTTTLTNDTLVIMLASRPDDNASTTVFSSPTAAGLTGVAEIGEGGGTVGNGGGWSGLYGVKATAGSTGTGSLTQTVSTTNAYITFAIKPPATAVTQAAFRFYEDGTESGSTAIAAQDTNITRNVSSDSNLALRVRLQESGTVAGASTDDYQLQYSRNGGEYADVGYGPNSLTDSVDVGTFTNTMSIGGVDGMSHSITGNGERLISASFYTSTTQVGTFVAYVYAHSGTYGTSSVPTGSPLATSVPFTTGAATGWQDLSFTGANRITLANGTNYALSFEVTASAGGVGGVRSNSTTTHPGNIATRTGGIWTAASRDLSFRLYTAPAGTALVTPHASASLTDGGATTNRLGAGTGSFVAGEVSETGLVTDHSLTASNYTEHLYSLTLVSSALSNDDTLDFRVLRNGAVLDTYSVTPRITVSPFTLVQSVKITNDDTTPGTAALSGVSAGSLITVQTVVASATAGIVTGVTDTSGNTYTKAVERNKTGATSGSIWYAYNVAAGSPTVSVAFNDAATNISAIVREWTGVMSTADPLDGTSGGTGTGTSIAASPGLTPTVNSLIIAGATVANGTSVITGGTGYVNTDSINTAGSTSIGVESRSGVASTSYTGPFTQTGSIDWTQTMAAFKPIPSGPVGTDVDITKTADYDVAASADITKSAQYAVPTTIDITKTAAYAVATTPSDITKSAAYDVAVPTTGTFGKTTNGSNLVAASSDAVVVSTATASANGTATSLTVRALVSANSASLRGVIYSDNAGAPGTLLAVTDDVVVSNTTEAEVTANFTGSNQISIVSGTAYWLGVHWQYDAAAVISVSRDATASGRREDYDTFSDGSPASYTVDATFTGPIDAYVTYSTAISTQSDITKSAQYTVTGDIDITKSATYAVPNVADITKGADYAVATTGDITKSADYDVSVTSDITKVAAYTVQTSADITKSADYDVSVSTDTTKGAAYAVATGTTITASAAYAVAVTGDITKTAVYTVPSTTDITRQATYAVAVTADITKGSAYTVPSDATVGLGAAYAVVTDADVTKGASYAVPADMTLTRGADYVVDTADALVRAAQYTVPSDGTIQLPSAYTVPATGDVTKAAAYAVAVIGDITKGAVYAVSVAADITKDAQYAVATTGDITRAAAYEVTASGDLTLSAAYTVIGTSDITKTAGYAVNQSADIGRTAGYAVASDGTLTAGAAYMVAADSDTLLSAAYAVHTTGDITKTAQYNVTATADITKAAAYVIRVAETTGDPIILYTVDSAVNLLTRQAPVTLATVADNSIAFESDNISVINFR